MASPETKAIDFDALGLGFHMPGADFDSLDYRQMIRSQSDWNVVAGILMACRVGNFDLIKDLFPVMKRNDGYLLWCACINIASYAGTWRTTVDLADAIAATSSDTENDPFVGMLFGSSCDLRAVDKLLQLYLTTDDLDTVNQIRADLSSQLEAANGEIFYGVEGDGGATELPSDETRERYSHMVRKRRDALAATIANPHVPVFEGRVYSVIDTARRLLAQIESEEEYGERFFRGKMIFEAATDTDCSGFFDEIGRLRRIEASAVLENFFDRDDLYKFQEGQRYFFGHPIPL